jgi:hypothetical protein
VVEDAASSSTLCCLGSGRCGLIFHPMLFRWWKIRPHLPPYVFRWWKMRPHLPPYAVQVVEDAASSSTLCCLGVVEDAGSSSTLCCLGGGRCGLIFHPMLFRWRKMSCPYVHGGRCSYVCPFAILTDKVAADVQCTAILLVKI